MVKTKYEIEMIESDCDEATIDDKGAWFDVVLQQGDIKVPLFVEVHPCGEYDFWRGNHNNHRHFEPDLILDEAWDAIYAWPSANVPASNY